VVSSTSARADKRSGSGKAPKKDWAKVSSHGSIDVGSAVGRGTMRISSSEKPASLSFFR